MHSLDKLDGLADDVLFEDNHLIAINKRPGDITQGDKTGDLPLPELAKSYIKQKYNKPGDVFLGVVHRLDRPVSGVVLMARTSKALSRMNELIRDRAVVKKYWAVTANPPPATEGQVFHHLLKNNVKNKSFVVNPQHPQASLAELSYRLIGKSERYYLLEINLVTGRHHQIRAQLAALGCPIRGDLKYGAPRSNPDGSIHLHARSLTFNHPVRQESIHIVAKPPQDPIWDAFLDMLDPSLERDG